MFIERIKLVTNCMKKDTLCLVTMVLFAHVLSQCLKFISWMSNPMDRRQI